MKKEFSTLMSNYLSLHDINMYVCYLIRHKMTVMTVIIKKSDTNDLRPESSI